MKCTKCDQTLPIKVFDRDFEMPKRGYRAEVCKPCEKARLAGMTEWERWSEKRRVRREAKDRMDERKRKSTKIEKGISDKRRVKQRKDYRFNKRINPTKINDIARKSYHNTKPDYFTVYVWYFEGKPIYVGQTSVSLNRVILVQYGNAKKGTETLLNAHIRSNNLDRKLYTVVPVLSCFNKKAALDYKRKFIKELKTHVKFGGCNEKDRI